MDPISNSKRHQRRLRKKSIQNHLDAIEFDVLSKVIVDHTPPCNEVASSSRSYLETMPSDPHSSDTNEDCVMEDTPLSVPEDLISDVEFPEVEDSYFLLSDSDCDSDDDKDETLQTFLRDWSLENNITQTALSKLLKGLKSWHPNLPRDARTLLKTPRDIQLTTMGQGEYYNFGLVDSICKRLNNVTTLDTSLLHLSFNIDGLPLYKSSGKQFWPILCLIEEDVMRKPFVVALYSGCTKPPIELYLNDFVNELSALEGNEFGHNGKKFSVEVRAFCCDTPAKAYVKCTKSYSGYFGCDRCSQRGVYSGRLTFPEINAPVRTDISFRQMENAEHHNSITPLSKLNIGLVSCFPLDYMHLVCLGVMRKFLLAWKDRNSPRRLSLKNIEQLSLSMVNAQLFWPSEFSRKPRSLKEIDRWKATEFRQFLLYLAPVYLKDLLADELYNHFMLLFCAITILISSEHMPFVHIADKLLRDFVLEASTLYGIEVLVYNVHCLVHLSADVLRLGPLDSFSAFPFENFLFSLKRMLRKTTKPLQQVCRRLKENEQITTTVHSLPSSFCVVDSGKRNHTESPNAGVNGTHYSKIIGPSFRLSTHKRDSCVYLCSGTVLKIANFVLDGFGSIFIIGQKFLSQEEFFRYPCLSSELSIFKVSNLSPEFYSYPITSVVKKAVLLPYRPMETFVCIPL